MSYALKGEAMTLGEIIDWLKRINDNKRRMATGDLRDQLREIAEELETVALKVVP